MRLYSKHNRENNMHFHQETATPKHLFAQFATQSRLTLEQCQEDIDPLMINICRWFNAIPGLTTRFCCESHSAEDVYSNRPYIMFAFVDDGLTTLIRFMNHLNGMISNVDEDGNGFSEIELSNCVNDELNWYLAAVLRGPDLPNDVIKTRWFLWFNEAMKTFVI